MHAYSAWNIEASQILTRGELAQVLADLKRRAARLPNVQMNLAIIRLASCCGLRASEIAGLRLGDVHTGVTRPFLSIRAETAKCGKPRRVPLWWVLLPASAAAP
jgi:integrase